MKNFKELIKKNKLAVTIATGILTVVLASSAIVYGTNNNLSKKVYSYDITGANDEIEVTGGKFHRTKEEFLVDAGAFKLKNEDLDNIKGYSAAISLEENGIKEYIYGTEVLVGGENEVYNIKKNEEVTLSKSGGDGKAIKKETLEMLDGKATLDLKFVLADDSEKEYKIPLKLTEGK